MIADSLQRRSQIEVEIKHVEAQFESVANRLRQGYDGGGDEVDKANDLVELAKAMVRCRYLQQKRRQLARAGARLAQGLAGVCEECGQPIDPARLEIWVGFTRCVSCQRRAEQKACRSRSYAA